MISIATMASVVFLIASILLLIIYLKSNDIERKKIYLFLDIISLIATIGSFAFLFVSPNSEKSDISISTESGNIFNISGGNPMITITNNEKDKGNKSKMEKDESLETLDTQELENIRDDSINLLVSEPSFISYLESIISEKRIFFYHYNDYNSDGNCELFALVRKVDTGAIDTWVKSGAGAIDTWANRGAGTIDFEVWFVDQKGGRFLEECSFVYLGILEPFLFDDMVFLALEDYWSSGSYTYLWGVNKDGNPYQPNLSGKCESVSLNQYNEIESTVLAYGSHEDESGNLFGRNRKPYYFYWNGVNFREYGGIRISIEDLYNINSAKEIVDQIYMDFSKVEENGIKLYSDIEILEIYYRENGIINIRACLQKTKSVSEELQCEK